MPIAYFGVLLWLHYTPTSVRSQVVFAHLGKHLRFAQKGRCQIVFYDIFVLLCAKNRVSQSKAVTDIGLARSTITKWKNGAVPSGSTLDKFAEYFGVSVDYLLKSSKDEPEEPAYEPTLNARDQRDVAKRLKETLDDLTNNTDGLMFDGEPLDEETKELLRISLQNQLEMTKLMAKKKYTPKKYQK